MAVTVSHYNHTAKLFANGEITLANLKLVLLNASATFNAAHTTISAVTSAGANEVSGNGWDAGGEALANAAITTVTTNDAKLDADDISVTASGGEIGPTTAGVIVDGTTPLLFIDFGGAQTAGAGTPFNVTWHANGIYTWTVA